MYPFAMEREKLKNILLKYYVGSTANSVLRGVRKPSYDVIVELAKEHDIPFDIWLDIKSYLKNDTKQDSDESNTINERKVS